MATGQRSNQGEVTEAHWRVWERLSSLMKKRRERCTFVGRREYSHVEIATTAKMGILVRQWCARKCPTIGPQQWKKPTAAFHSVNAPTMADFKLPMWRHWTSTWEKTLTVGSRDSSKPLPGILKAKGRAHLILKYEISTRIFPVLVHIISPKSHLHSCIDSCEGSSAVSNTKEDTQLCGWWSPLAVTIYV